MNKKQKLRFITSDNSFDLRTDQSNIDTVKDSTIIFPKVPVVDEFSTPFESKTDSLHFESSVCEDISTIPIENMSKKEFSFRKLFVFDHRVFPYCVVIVLVVYIMFKPSDYKFLLEEVEKLRVQGNSPILTSKMENIASLSEGTYVGEHSELYKFGFFMTSVTDKNSILEPGMFSLALKSDEGFLEIHFKPKSKIQKFAIYHPEIGNSGSAIKDFSLLINEKKFDFIFNGIGYQEFGFETQIADSLRLEFYSNHGEPRYTSIYRVYIFA